MAEPIYMDYNATTPLDSQVIDGISRALLNWGNPSSGYQRGKLAKAAVEKARSEVCQMIGANSPHEITFTSGGTEANHLAIFSAINKFREKCHENKISRLPHIITTNIEHCAMEAPLRKLEAEGCCAVTFVRAVRGTGRVAAQHILDAITENTCMISVILANNETGVIQPVHEIFSKVRQEFEAQTPLILHTDAAQAIGKIPVNVAQLQADMVTIVGHKFYGPRIGALYHRENCQGRGVVPFFLGGGQEHGLRAGTENTPMIVGLGIASNLVTQHLDKYAAHMKQIREYLCEQLIRNFDLVMTEKAGQLELGQVSWRFVDLYTLPNTLSLRVGGINGAELLDTASSSFNASTGAACHTGGCVSQVLLNSWDWGVQEASQTIRLSVGRETSKEDIDIVVAAIRSAVDTELEKSIPKSFLR